MLTEKQLLFLPERIAARIQAFQTEYLISIGKQIKEIGELSASNINRLQAMYNAGISGAEMADKLAIITGRNVADIYEVFDAVARDGYEWAKPFYEARNIPFIPYEENEYLQNFARSAAKTTADSYINMSQTAAFDIFGTNGEVAPVFAAAKTKLPTGIADTYVRVVDDAITKSALGLESYQSAMTKVIDAMSQSGIKTVNYASGYSRRLDSSARQNVLWGLKEFNQNVADMVGEQFGADGYEISYHSHPRPTHEEMGGRQYAIGAEVKIDGVKYPSFAEVADLLNDYNCLHYKYPILLGISKPAYDKKELAALKKADRQQFEFDGKSYTKYEASQVQRQLETEIRKEKDRAVMATAAGIEQKREKAQKYINQLTAKYNSFSKASGLPTSLERLYVRGFRNYKIA